MTIPDDKRRKSPVDRFRNILSAEQPGDRTGAARRYSRTGNSPGLNLPAPHRPEEGSEAAGSLLPVPTGGGMYRPEGRSLLPVFWTVASVISLVFNVVLLIVLLSLLRTLGSLDAANLGPGLLGGLYSNFERMDAAHIRSDIPVQTTIPLNLSIPVQTTTSITLARDVSIPRAHVKINNPLFNIDAPADVTLPAGTALDVNLNFMLPLQTSVPISMQVPVDIPLQNTDLHPAVLGLQDTIRPLYCIVNPAAQSLTGQSVCR